jgi:hypothetical protein
MPKHSSTKKAPDVSVRNQSRKHGKTVTRVHTRLLDTEPTDDGYDSRQFRKLTTEAYAY